MDRLLLEVEHVPDYPMDQSRIIDGKNYEVTSVEYDYDGMSEPDSGRIWLSPRLDLDNATLRADLARVTEELDEARTRIKKVLEIAHNLRADRDELRQDYDDFMTEISRAIGPNAGQFMDGPWSDMDDVVRNMRTGIDKISADNARLREAVREAANLLRRIARDECREGKSPMAATKGAEAAEAALKGGENVD